MGCYKMALQSVGGKYEGVWTNELKNGDVAFYINFRDQSGKPVKKKVGVKNKQRNFTVKDAYDKLIEVKHKLNTGEELPIKNLRADKFLMNNAFEAYIERAKTEKKTWKTDLWVYNKHIKNSIGKQVLKNLDFKIFEQLKADKTDEGWKPQTVKHILGLCRQIINHAIKYELIKNYSNPLSNGRVKMPTIDNARQSFLTKDEALKLLDILYYHPNQQTYRLVLLALSTGGRLDEIVSLTWNDINFTQETIYFKATKGGNARHVAISPRLMSVLADLKRESEDGQLLIIPSANKTKIERPQEIFMEALEKVVPHNSQRDAKHKITFHSLRHTHASWLAMDGLDLLNIKEQLGHKTIQMTMRYSHLIPQKRYEVVKRLLQD